MSIMMEDYQTTEHVKEEVVDCGFVEVSQDVHQLCTACLCATRTTRTLDDDALKQYYMHILTEMQVEGGVAVSQSPRLCWECAAHLKRSVRFREQVQDSYRLLQPMLSMCNKEDLDEFLQTSVCRPGRLKIHLAHSINISPFDDDMQLMTVTKQEDDNDDHGAAALCYFDFAPTVEQSLDTFCGINTANCVSEDDIKLSLMQCYRGPERSNEQWEKTTTRKEDVNSIDTIKTPNPTHEVFRDLENNFVCDYCHKRFTLKAALERHIATFNIYPHSNKKDCAVVLCSDYQCSECPNGRKCNMMLNIVKKYQCGLCHKSFSLKRVLENHIRSHTGEKTGQFNKLFSYQSASKVHKKKKSVSYTGEKRHLCEICLKSFTKTNYLLQHLRTHTGQKPFKCDLCHKSFSRKNHIVFHLKTHTGEKPFQCEMCHKSFGRKSGLIKHKSRVHSGVKPFHCKICYKSFSHQSSLLVHLSTHTGEKLFPCEVCHESFTTKQKMCSHLTAGTGVKPFQCEMCHKSFKQKFCLEAHLRRTHTDEKPFVCEMCHKSFIYKSELITHQRIHSGEKPFQCEMCHKSFAQKGTLINHKKIHTGEKPFQCELCHKSFTAKFYMLAHLRTHSDETPFECAVCYKTYKMKQSFVSHIRTHTNKAPC